MLIDGSDIGLAATDIDGFEWRPDGTQLLSFDAPVTLPGIPFLVDDSDIVRFIPSRLGATTAEGGSSVPLAAVEGEVERADISRLRPNADRRRPQSSRHWDHVTASEELEIYCG